MRILFAGSAPFSLPVLEYLFERNNDESEITLAAVLTSPDRPAGRGMKVKKSPVKESAEQVGIRVLQPERLRGEVLYEVAELDFDLLICAAYGKFFGPKFLSLFKKGTANIHPSLLPRYRGAAPIPAAIMAGDRITGVSLQEISTVMDSGDIFLQTECCVASDDTVQTLIDVLSVESVKLVEALLADFDAIYKNKRVQDANQAVYCTKIDTHMGYVQWWESASHLHRLVRGLCTPYSGLKLYYKGQVLKIWDAVVVSEDEVRGEVGAIIASDETHGLLLQCVRGILGLRILQLPGRKKLFWKEFLQGERDILEVNLKQKN